MVSKCGGVTSACVCLTLSTAMHVHVGIILAGRGSNIRVPTT